MPKVSIIIASYNPPKKHVQECLESIMKQSFKDYEIVWVDDGSTIDSRSILEQYLDTVKFICNEHGGPNKARDRGLREAKGEYLALIDQDDLWVPHKLEQQVSFLDAHPGIDFLFSNFQNFNKNGFIGDSFFKTNTEISKITCIPGTHDNTYKIISDSDILYKFIKGDFIIQCTAMARTDFCRKYDIFSTRTNARTFYEFFMRTIHRIRLAYTDEVLAHRRIHDNNITGSSELYYGDTAVIYEHALQYVWINERCRELIKKKLKYSRIKLGKYYFVKGKYQSARNALKQAMHDDFLSFRASILYCLTFIVPRELLLQIKKFKSKLKGKE